MEVPVHTRRNELRNGGWVLLLLCQPVFPFSLCIFTRVTIRKLYDVARKCFKTRMWQRLMCPRLCPICDILGDLKGHCGGMFVVS